ncbi:Histone-lysine N-methyltransferase MECOM, partial [Dissostichus eleginoides]
MHSPNMTSDPGTLRGDGDDEFALYPSDILDDVCGSDGDPAPPSALAEDPASPLLSDDEASPQHSLSFQHPSIFLPQEDLTVPLDFELRESAVPCGGLGIWSHRRINEGERFGPYEGEHTPYLRDPTQGWEGPSAAIGKSHIGQPAQKIEVRVTGQGDVTDRGALKWRSHLERLMEGPERPGPVVTDWGEFVTREATALQSHHHKFGGFIHKGEERVMAPMMLYEYSNAAATIRQRVRIRGESYPALNEPQTRSPTGLWVLGLEKPGASCCRSDGRS